ncbi:hypothetical protein [Tautonia marina]|uniref:hypothetical protein n=1 Tax=Tautonia marina TaxID=2653855 RepID=UPI0012610DBB|nr:hypothetical protein [Tautonia marina]
MDILTPVVPEDRQHPNFRMLTSIELSGPERAVLQGWADGFRDRDGKFAKEFQTTYNSSFWELYLFAAFRELGCDVDQSHSSPDFVLRTPVGEIVAEATIASHAEGYAPEWERPDPEARLDVNREELITLATIRLANAVTSKHRKYFASYATLPHVAGKPYVICVAPFEQPFFFMQNDLALRRVLYGFDQHIFIDDKGTGARLVLGVATRDSVTKDNGSQVPLGLFTRPGMEDVSAVIFSNTATFTKVQALASEGSYPVIFLASRYNAAGIEPHLIRLPRPHYQETLLDGLHVCLNPFATRPLDPGWLLERGAALHTYDPATKEYSGLGPDGFLIQHGSFSALRPGMARGFAREPKPPDSFKRPSLPDFPEGQLVAVGGQVMSFVDHHLGHYRGWTVMVARDRGDNDWGAQAFEGLYRSLAECQSVPKEMRYLPAADWRATRDEAFEDMKRRIDREVARSRESRQAD